MGLRAPTLVLLALTAACTRGERDAVPNGSATSLAASSTSTGTSTSTRNGKPLIDFLAPGDTCAFGHRGVLLDLGDAASLTRLAGAKLALPDVELREHEGASWVGVRSRSLEASFVSSAELKSDAGIVIEARVKGALAKSASVYLNGKPIGTLPLTRGETTIASVRAQGVVLRGTNDLLLRFNGGPRTGHDPHDQLAEIDWIRVGPNDGDAPYSAPTLNDAVTSVSIAGAPHRAVSLRAPGFARCSAFLPSGAMLEGLLGATGGEAEAEVRVLVDRAEPRVVASYHLGGPADPKGWRPIAVPLGNLGTLAAVELVAKTSSKGARVAFAEARVTAPAEAVETPPAAISGTRARGVILVALGTVSRRMLSLYGGATAMPELANLASGGWTFDAHRATSGFASGALGSMLTGVSPREHGASGPDTALSPSVFTVTEAARQAGIVTAMFTANPSTTEPYGFARGSETFVSRLPGADDVTATSVFEDASRWIEGHKDDRFFVVIHARGGHPPWDVPAEELKDLPPSGYNGSLEPKHAGEALAKARKAGAGRLFADPDRERAFALHSRALVEHDAALGALVARVRALHRDQDTVWIVTGDVGIDATAHVPFLEDESLEEGALAVPLVLRGLGAAAPPSGAGHINAATSGVDVAPTILEAFGLPPPGGLRGDSLWAIATRKKPGPERPLIAATTTHFSARWGAFAVVGARDREVKICDLSLDPDCATDVRPSHPLAAEALHSLAWNELVAIPADKTNTPQPQPAAAIPKVVADGATSAALKVWGR